VRELRPWSTLGPPVLLSVLAAVGLVIGAPAWFLMSFGLLLAASVLIPVFFYVARPRAAARLARKHPVRHISMSVDSLTILMGEHSVVVEWSRVTHIWRAHGYTLLVLDKFTAISIPDSSFPAGAREFMHSSVKNA
jgi:hypothetical protein